MNYKNVTNVDKKQNNFLIYFYLKNAPQNNRIKTESKKNKIRNLNEKDKNNSKNLD